MNTIRYNLQFLWVTTHNCNFDCKYCIDELMNTDFSGSGINISALNRVLEKGNHTARFILTGGEPCLMPDILEVCRVLTRKHLIVLSTNLISEKIRELAATVPPERLAIQATIHFRELERHNLLELFVDNYNYCKGRGVDISLDAVAYPGFVDDLDRYKAFFSERNMPFRFYPFLGFYEGRQYPEDYSAGLRKTFGLHRKDIRKLHRFPFFCNAGYNHFTISPKGTLTRCFQYSEPLCSVYDEIPAEGSLFWCRQTYCDCCSSRIDPYLYKMAISRYSRGLLRFPAV